MIENSRDMEFGLGVLHFENAKTALLRIFCRNDFEMVVSVISKKLTVSLLVQKTRFGEGLR